jgi:hypothetical protein
LHLLEKVCNIQIQLAYHQEQNSDSQIRLCEPDGGNRLDGKRAVALGLVFVPLGVVSLIWKKHHVFTVIEYKDENNENRTIILDFEENTRNVQPVIYDRMVGARTQIVEPITIQETKRYMPESMLSTPEITKQGHTGGPFN